MSSSARTSARPRTSKNGVSPAPELPPAPGVATVITINVQVVPNSKGQWPAAVIVADYVRRLRGRIDELVEAAPPAPEATPDGPLPFEPEAGR